MQPSASCYRCGGGGSSSNPLDDDKELDLARCVASRQSLPGIPMVVYALLFLAHRLTSAGLGEHFASWWFV